jgi:PadR family transcriptional regulator, regulatory protein PadR
LLLVSEKPGYGYSLVKDLQDLRFGQVERPAVYRALGQLERDGLVTVWDEPAKAGQARKVYGITDNGARVLRAWMGVVKEERDCLDRVLQRYQASGTADAALAQVEGAWQAALGHAWSPVSSTCASGRRLAVHEGPPRPVSILTPRPSAGQPDAPTRCQFRVVPERSVVMIEARSTVGPIRFGAMGLTGSISLDMRAGEICCESRPSADLVIAVNELRSGNGLYDAELLRRIEARKFPRVTLALQECTPIGTGDRYRLAAEVTFHGITRPLRGTVGVQLQSKRKLVVTGDHALDVRDFQLPSPTVLMLRIYPDVRVNLHVEAELAE